MNEFFDGLMRLGFWQWVGLILLVEAVGGLLRDVIRKRKS